MTPMKAHGLIKGLLFIGILFLISCQKNLYPVVVSKDDVVQVEAPQFKISIKYPGDYKFLTKIRDKVSKKELQYIYGIIGQKRNVIRNSFIYQGKTIIPPYFSHYLLKINENSNFPLNKVFKLGNVQYGLAYYFEHSGSFFLLVQLRIDEDLTPEASLRLANYEFKNIIERLRIITPD